MLKTKNYNMNKPELPDSVDISKLNENFDIIDEKVKEVETKAENIKVPVQSVNNKTGAVVLNSTDIKCTDGTTVEAKLSTKADTFNKSDAINSTSSTDVATSHAVKTAYDMGIDSYMKSMEAMHKIGQLTTGKQDYTVIDAKSPTDVPGSYPLGYSTFFTSDADAWGKSCGATVIVNPIIETCHAKLNWGIIQKITWFNSSNKTLEIFQRSSYSSRIWGDWVRTLDNTTQITDLKTKDKTIVGAINEAFTYANNGKIAIANAIIGKGVNASKTDTFPELADKISSISTGYAPYWAIKKWNRLNTWTEGERMSHSTAFNHGFCVVGDKIHLLAGFISGAQKDHLVYDTQQNTWSTAKEVPEEHSFSYAEYVDGIIYLFVNTDPTTTLFEYNVKNDTWSPGKLIPGFRYLGNYASSCVVGNNIYFIGLGSSMLSVFNTITHTFTDLRGPGGGGTASRFGKSATSGDTIYVLYEDFNTNRIIRSYNTKTKVWNDVVLIDDKLSYGFVQKSAIALFNNDLYILGGYHNGHDFYSANVKSYNLITKEFRSRASMPSNKQCDCVVTVGNNIYVINGYNKNSGHFRTTEMYVPE